MSTETIGGIVLGLLFSLGSQAERSGNYTAVAISTKRFVSAVIS